MNNLRKITLTASTFLVPFALPAQAQNALPTGGSIAAGTAAIGTPSGGSLAIAQLSERAIINWDSFDIAAGNTVRFIQPSVNAATLNRVPAGATSTIAGNITANGSVYLINPNGIQITSSGAVQVGRGFVASTLDIADHDFMAGRNLFAGSGGTIDHQGSIITQAGGFVGLLGGEVRGAGTILSPAGTVMVAGTTRATLDPNGGGFLQVLLPTSAALAGNGTTAALTAEAARQAVRYIVNIPDEATVVAGANGNVMLTGTITAANGTVNVASLGDVGLDGGGLINIAGAGSGGSVTLRADAAGLQTGTVSFANGGAVTTATSGRADIYYNPTSYTTPTDFSPHITGGNTTSWMLVNTLQNLQDIQTNLSGQYALTRDIDASDTANWNNGAGFVPLGNMATSFEGWIDGQGRTISNLTINRPTEKYVGLVGHAFSMGRPPRIENIGLLRGSISGLESVGGIIGISSGATIRNAYVAFTDVSGQKYVGGIAGNSFAYQSGSGGYLVYASGGSVSGESYVGGLFGSMGGTAASMTYVFATNRINGTDNSTTGAIAGGLSGPVSKTYWDSYASGLSVAVGEYTGSSLNATALTSEPGQENASNYIYKASAWSDWSSELDTTGGQAKAWRMYDGLTTPLLKAFLTPVAVSSSGSSNFVYSGGQQSPASVRYSAFADPTLISGTYTADSPSTDVGTYAINISPLSSTQQGYDLIADAYTITPRPLTIKANLASRVYGNSNPYLTFTVDGSVNGYTPSGALATTATVTSNVGEYDITQGTLTVSPNFTLIYEGAKLTVNPRPLTITYTASAVNRLYGDANPTFSGTYAGNNLVNGDMLTGPATWTTPANTLSNVAKYAIIGSGVMASSNYTVTTAQAPGNSTALNITKRPISVDIHNKSRMYGTANPAFTYSVSNLGYGLVNGDNLAGSPNTLFDTSTPVGNYPIDRGDLRVVTAAGATNNNYILSAMTGTLAITPRPLTVTADALSRIYGDANPALTFTVGAGQLYGSDTIASVLSGALTTSANSTSGVGSYAITQGTLAASPNYALSVTGSTLTINPRALTVTADALSRIYGAANPALTYSVADAQLVNGDTIASVLSGALATTANTTSGVGSYAINKGTLATSSNYALDFVDGTLTINPRALAVTADAMSRIYGAANPTLTYSVADGQLVNGDTIASVFSGALGTTANTTSGVGTYAITKGNLTSSPNYTLSFTGNSLTVTPRPLNVTADALSRIYGAANPALTYAIGSTDLANGDTLASVLSGALATTATTASGVGNYAINQGSLTTSANYALNFTGSTLTINPRQLNVTADALSRIYGAANPTLTYAIGSGDLVNGDTAASVLSGALATTATTASGVGTYGINQGSLTASPNYVLSFNGSDLAITPRAVTVTADALSRIYGAANPTLTYAVGGEGLVNGDTLSGALATTATTTSGVGSYGISQGSLSASPNYTLSFTGNNLAIRPRALTIIANPQERVAGLDNPQLTYTVDGLVGDDSLTGELVTEATLDSAPGTYTIGRGSLSASPNYEINFTSGEFTVMAGPMVATSQSIEPTCSNARLVPGISASAGLSSLDLKVAFHRVGFFQFGSRESDTARAHASCSAGGKVKLRMLEALYDGEPGILKRELGQSQYPLDFPSSVSLSR